MNEPSSKFSVSVVIPLFNKEGSIANTIGSVLRQSRLPDELIIVDDGSKDSSAYIAKSVLAEAGDDIAWTFIAQENAGVSVARNRGADESRSRYIAFLDADDEWSPEYVAELQRLATACPSAAVLTVRSAERREDGRIVPRSSSLPDFFGTIDNPLDRYRKGYGIIHTSGTAIRRDAWDRSGGFPVGATNSQDVFLWLRLCTSESFAHSSRPLSIWRGEYSGIVGRKGAVPYHLNYFLGTNEGREELRNPDLLKFLASNSVVQLARYKLIGDRKVVAEIRRLSRVLPLYARLKCAVASVTPVWCIRSAAWWRRRSREHSL